MKSSINSRSWQTFFPGVMTGTTPYGALQSLIPTFSGHLSPLVMSYIHLLCSLTFKNVSSVRTRTWYPCTVHYIHFTLIVFSRWLVAELCLYLFLKKSESLFTHASKNLVYKHFLQYNLSSSFLMNGGINDSLVGFDTLNRKYDIRLLFTC